MDDVNYFANLSANDSEENQEIHLAKFRGEQLESLDDDNGQLTIDVYQTTNEIVVESPIAGVNPEDIDISITTDSVTIKGKREREREIKNDDYVYQECYWGKFSRSVVLPQEVDVDKVDASIKNGVLTIRLPKLNRLKSKKIKS